MKVPGVPNTVPARDRGADAAVARVRVCVRMIGSMESLC